MVDIEKMDEMKYEEDENGINPYAKSEGSAIKSEEEKLVAFSKDSSVVSFRHEDSSVFSFRDVSLMRRNRDVNLLRRKAKETNKKYILQGVSGSVHSGHVLAIMGPSGAGKSSFLSAITLEAFSLKSTGSVTLNGVPVTRDLLKHQFFVVKQFDKFWPYLTCREALTYAAQLYQVGENKEDRDAAVAEIIKKMGLVKCSDNRCVRLSGGEQRRLSIATALLKRARVIVLDEPTSGLDGAAACKVMQEVVHIAKEEGLIIIFTIHQPSSKIFKMFDQIMILSKGQQAYCGDAKQLVSYFQEIGHPCPPATNPVEFVMDLVNADFFGDEAVNEILSAWKIHASSLKSTPTVSNDYDIENNDMPSKFRAENSNIGRNSLVSETLIGLRRQATLMSRDPVLYLGRFFMFFVANMLMAVIYWKGWENDQIRALEKMWTVGMFLAVTGCMAVVAVPANNAEFKSLLAESKNGMVNLLSYVIAKTILVFPVIVMCSISSLAIPAFVVQQWPISRVAVIIGLHSLSLYCYECCAECLAVWFDEPIMGMIFYLLYWILTFVFGGIFIPGENVVWPLRILYYATPYQYYYRSVIYEIFMNTLFCPCTTPLTSAICANSYDSAEVLISLGRIFPIFSPENTVTRDALVLFGLGVFFKIMYVLGVIYKGRRTSKFEPA